MDDNLYPRSSAYLPTEPEEQKKERERERARVQEALPLIQEIIARFDERIAFYSSIDSVPRELDTNPDEHMHVVAANRIVRDNLLVEKNALEELAKAYAVDK